VAVMAVVLVSLSALLHALWNFFGKKSGSSPAFFAVSFITTPLLAVPLVWQYFSQLPGLPVLFWQLVLASGVMQAWYMWSLARAYATGDISIAYPLARALPLIIVTVTTVLLGHYQSVSYLGVLGIMAIVVGSLLLPMKHLKDFSWRHYANQSTLFALCAACGTAGYSIFDDRAVKLLAEVRQLLSDGDISLLYIWLQSVAAALLMTLQHCCTVKMRSEFRQALTEQLLWATVTGVIIMVTYMLILWSMQYVENVSYVVAFRQLSIPIGVLLGVLFLGEHFHIPKRLGTVLISAGLVAVALG